MDFVSLVTHGLSAMSVFAEVVGVRLLVATSVLSCIALAGLIAVLAIRLGTGLAIPGWASMVAGCLMIILLQACIMSLIFVFVSLQWRNNLTFLPLRDYRYFLHETWRVDTDA